MAVRSPLDRIVTFAHTRNRAWIITENPMNRSVGMIRFSGNDTDEQIIVKFTKRGGVQFAQRRVVVDGSTHRFDTLGSRDIEKLERVLNWIAESTYQDQAVVREALRQRGNAPEDAREIVAGMNYLDISRVAIDISVGVRGTGPGSTDKLEPTALTRNLLGIPEKQPTILDGTTSTTPQWVTTTPTSTDPNEGTMQQAHNHGCTATIAIDREWDRVMWIVTTDDGKLIGSSDGWTGRTVFGARLECANAITLHNNRKAQVTA